MDEKEPGISPSDVVEGDLAHDDVESIDDTSSDIPRLLSSGDFNKDLSDDLSEELSEEIVAYLSREMTTEFCADLEDEIVDNLEDEVIADLEDEVIDVQEDDIKDLDDEMPEKHVMERTSCEWKELVASDGMSMALAIENSGNKISSWFHSPVFVLLPLIVFICCSAALLMLGHKAFVHFNGEISGAVQAISESENRMDKRLQNLENLLLKEIAGITLDVGRDAKDTKLYKAKAMDQEQSPVIQEHDQYQTDGTIEKIVEKTVEKTVEKIVDKTVEETVEKLDSTFVEHAADEQSIRIKHKRATKRKKNKSSDHNLLSSCFKIYNANDNDTLWQISQNVYGAGQWYPVLLLHNPDLSIYQISRATRIRYLCDKSLLSQIYKSQFFFRKTGNSTGMFWRYKVRQGDTISDLQKKYCFRKIQIENCMDIKKLPEPGKSIIIRLE